MSTERTEKKKSGILWNTFFSFFLFFLLINSLKASFIILYWTYRWDNHAVTINTDLFVHTPASIWDSSGICSLHQEVTVVPPHDSSLVSVLFSFKLYVSTSVISLITRKRIQLLFHKWTLTNNFLLSKRGGKQRLRMRLLDCRTMQRSFVGVCINHVEGVYELCFGVRDGNSLTTW